MVGGAALGDAGAVDDGWGVGERDAGAPESVVGGESLNETRGRQSPLRGREGGASFLVLKVRGDVCVVLIFVNLICL